MEDNRTLTLEELEQEKYNLEKENEFLKMRKMDVALYQKAFEKYVACEFGKPSLTYDKLYKHPDYYTKWRNTFFDSQIKLIESGIFVRRPDDTEEKTLEELNYLVERKRYYSTLDLWTPLSKEEIKEQKETMKYGSDYVYSPNKYEDFSQGITKFSELIYDEKNPSKIPTYLNVDMPWAIIGHCDSVKSVDGKYQLHLTDPYGDCLFPPFDITAEEAELALGRICVVNCAYNHYATEPKLLELQILPFTLTEKLGEYTKDTVIIRRYPKINFKPWAFLG